MDSSENSGSDWDSAPETMGRSGVSQDPGLRCTEELWGCSRTKQGRPKLSNWGTKEWIPFKWEMTASSTQESGRPEAGETIPKPGQDPVDSDGTGKHGGSPEEELNPSVAEALVEKPGRHQKLLGWLRGLEQVGSRGLPTSIWDLEECLQISTNLTLHLLELLASALLGLCLSPCGQPWTRWACVDRWASGCMGCCPFWLLCMDSMPC